MRCVLCGAVNTRGGIATFERQHLRKKQSYLLEVSNPFQNMANSTISMNKIRQILRMYSQGRSRLSIAAQTGVSRNTAKKYLATFAASGL
jgi:response regulator of citrate/malate metabolism